MYKNMYNILLYKNKNKINTNIYDKSSSIPNIFLKYNFKLYKGNKYLNCNINKWIVGFKFGEFTWNRKVALYKAKQLKKKKK